MAMEAAVGCKPENDCKKLKSCGGENDYHSLKNCGGTNPFGGCKLLLLRNQDSARPVGNCNFFDIVKDIKLGLMEIVTFFVKDGI